MKKILLFLLLTFWCRPAWPCGGVGFADIDDALISMDSFFQELIEYDDYSVREGSFEAKRQILFYYPFFLEEPELYVDIWNETYFRDQIPLKNLKTERSKKEKFSLAKFETHLHNQNFDSAYDEALFVYNNILKLPHKFTAYDYRQEFKRTSEFLALKPHLKKVDPYVVENYFLNHTLPQKKSQQDIYVEKVLRVLSPVFVSLHKDVPEVLREALQIWHKRAETAAPISTTNKPLYDYLFIKKAMKTKIPNGYLREIQKRMTSEQWQHLDDLHANWLKNNSNHVLKPYVLLSLVRLNYLRGNTAKVWDILFDLYPDYKPRVVSEMRFLAYKGFFPNLDHPKMNDQVLSALLGTIGLRENEWQPTWQKSLQHKNTKWGQNMQERLLVQAIQFGLRKRRLPEAFAKTQKDNASDFYFFLRAMAFATVEKWQEAHQEIQKVSDKFFEKHLAHSLQAKILLKLNRLEDAVLYLEHESASYVIRFLATQDELKKIMQSPNVWLKSEAHMALAIEYAHKNKWQEGVELLRGPAKRLWQKVLDLKQDSTIDGNLKLARFFKKHRGEIFYKTDTEWYRAVNYRYRNVVAQLKNSTKDSQSYFNLKREIEQIRKNLKTSSELYWALKYYKEWLNHVPITHPEYVAVVEEANSTYRTLVDWDHSNSGFWFDVLKDSPEAKAIRSYGRKKK